MRKGKKWKDQLYIIIFESDTPNGKAFDIGLIICILCSSLLVMAFSIEILRERYGTIMFFLEWLFIGIFTLEYILRIICARKRLRYITSFFGIVDLLAILPVFISFFIPAANYLVIVRIFRLLRLFRVLKMVRYVEESGILLKALIASKPKIIVFLITIFSIITIVGSLMYVIEGPENGFTSIPESMYWAIVTVSTVGYGDISPQTGIGKLLASLLMIVAYGILAVPTGIISYELAQGAKHSSAKKVCPNCNTKGHGPDAEFCRKCGVRL